jgi:uncharacterized protein GlcG (DUF336 family)
MTLAAARDLVERAERAASAREFTMSIAVVDEGGNLVLFQKMDGAQLGSIEVAIGKARSALLFQRPTKVFEDRIASGWTPLLALAGGMPIDGGLPLSCDGAVVGAIGVSGAKAFEDGEVAAAAVGE